MRTEKIVDGEVDAIEKQSSVKHQHFYSTFHGASRPIHYHGTSPRYLHLLLAVTLPAVVVYYFLRQYKGTQVGHEADDVVEKLV